MKLALDHLDFQGNPLCHNYDYDNIREPCMSNIRPLRPNADDA